MKEVRCCSCGKKLDPEHHDFDKDGQPMCHECWVVEDERLEKEIR